MARGWESKSVEAQQAERIEASSQRHPPMSKEEAARWREWESLRLSRQTVLQQFEASTNPRHRKMLQDSLAALDEKLKQNKEQSQASDHGPRMESTDVSSKPKSDL